jgi:hypothetical protein
VPVTAGAGHQHWQGSDTGRKFERHTKLKRHTEQTWRALTAGIHGDLAGWMGDRKQNPDPPKEVPPSKRD